MTGETFLDVALTVSVSILLLSFGLIIVRIVRGPTLPDRILALDLLIAVVIGFIAAYGIGSGFTVYVDIAIALGLVGFLSTVALARFVMQRHDLDDDEAADTASGAATVAVTGTAGGGEPAGSPDAGAASREGGAQHA
jgi:multicomponent Na+:H+ antiporter subunit F